LPLGASCYGKRVELQDQSGSIVWFQKISIPPPQRVIGNSEGEGVFKAKTFKGKYEPKLEIPEGWGFQPPKNPPWGSMDIFWNNTFGLVFSCNVLLTV